MALWVKRLIAQLTAPLEAGGAGDIVETAKLSRSWLTVRYRTGMTAYWQLASELNRAFGTLGPPLLPNRQYAPPLGQIDDEFRHHLILPIAARPYATPLDIELGAQRMAAAIMRMGYCGRQHPSVLQNDLAALRLAAADETKWANTCLPKSGRRQGQLCVCQIGRRYPGRALQLEFYDIGNQAGVPSNLTMRCQQPIVLRRAIMWLARRGRNVTTDDVMRHLLATPIVHSPVAYIVMLRKWRFQGTILDTDPQLGYKALACAALGLPYQGVTPVGFNDFVGLHIGTGQPDLVIADGCLQRRWQPPQTEPSWYARHGGSRPQLLLFVPRERQSTRLPKWLGQPRWRVRVCLRLGANPDYLFVF